MTNAYAAPQADLTGPMAQQGAMSEGMLNAMQGTKGWVLLIGILLYVGAAFMLLAAAGTMFSVRAMTNNGAPGLPSGMFGGLAVFYAVLAIVYIVLGTFLVKYSSAIDRLLTTGQAEDMEEALHQQRKFWRLSGVLSLLLVLLMVLGVVAAIAIPFMNRA